MKTSVDLRTFRDEFPLLKGRSDFIYFDSAATTHKPRSVIEAMNDFYQNQYGTVHRAIYSLSREATVAYHGARKKVQAFLHASSEKEIIFTRGATASLNLVARSFGQAFLHPGDEVLVSAIEHHSNIVPWQMICEHTGATLKVIPVNERGEIEVEAYLSMLSPRVKIISFAHLSNVLGTLHPVKELTAVAHAVGAAVCVDGAQSAGHLSVDVQDLDVDFFVFSAHKLYGPTGIGVLYGKEKWLDQMPPLEGGGDMIEEVRWEKTTYAPLPLKFEAGTPMIAEAIGLGAAIDYLSDIGMDKITAWENHLLAIMTNALQTFPGLRILGTSPKKGAIISFVIDGVHPLDLASLLDCRGIAIRSGHHCSQPTMARYGISSTSRISFGLYNTPDEIERFLLAFQEIVSLLR